MELARVDVAGINILVLALVDSKVRHDRGRTEEAVPVRAPGVIWCYIVHLSRPFL